MRLVLLVFALPIACGCMSRAGLVDYTTGRAYPGFSKPLNGGPGDPFLWLCGDRASGAACCMKCAYTPFGGRTLCGERMRYRSGSPSGPAIWAPPAMPSAPGVIAIGSPHPVSPPPETKAAATPDVPPAPSPRENKGEHAEPSDKSPAGAPFDESDEAPAIAPW